MMAKKRPFDPVIFFSVLALVAGGFLIFMSASLGILVRGDGQFSDIAASQFVLGIAGGFIALYVTSHVPYRFWRQYALYFFAAAALLTLLVFAPGIGLELNGARRWLDLGITTLQPAEVLKIAYVLYLGSWLARRQRATTPFIMRVGPFAAITALTALLLLIQPDTGTFLVIAAAGGAMYIASGAKWKDIALIALAGIIGLSGVVLSREYAADRIKTFFDSGSDPLGSSYQIRQSLIAVGSGRTFGRGFGQSVQKFNYLPEPASDSIFAVFAEEFGFLGSVFLIFGFLFFGLRSLFIAARAPDKYGGLIAVGIAILVIAQSFLNIASMLAVVPLTGLPLIFISHGGSALFMALASVGILLNISRFRRA